MANKANANVHIEDIVKAAAEDKLNELEILRQSLTDKNNEIKSLQSQFLRLKAEFDNYRKRVEKEKEQKYQFGKEVLLRELITLIDVFDDAVSSAKSTTNCTSVVKGLELLYKEFTSFLQKEGVKLINCIGEKLNPLYHEVVETEEIADVEDGIIVAELQKGYIFNNTVLRAAKVKLCKKATINKDKHLNNKTTDTTP